MPSDDLILPPDDGKRRGPVDDHFPKQLKLVPATQSDLAAPDPARIPLSAGSVLTPDQLAAVIHALATPGELAKLPHSMTESLVQQVAEVVALTLNLPNGPRPHPVGPLPNGPRLVERARSEGSEPVLYVIDGERRRSTGYRKSEVRKANAVLELHKMIKQAEVIGMVLPTQVLIDVVIGYYLSAKRPTGTTAAPAVNSYVKDRYHAKSLLDYFAGKRLVDLTGPAINAYTDWRMTQPGKRAGLDDEPALASDQTVRNELDFLTKALNRWKKDSGMQWAPTIEKPKRNPPRVAWLHRGEAARALLGARGWLWDEEKGGWKTHKVWDPLGREWYVDPDTGEMRVRRLGHGAWVERPVVSRHARHGYVCRKNGVARAMIIAYYTGTRALPLRLLRWDSDGVHGYPDFKAGILYRSGIKWPKTTKKQGPVELCARLFQHMLRWEANDRKAGINWICHHKWGRKYSRQIDHAIRWAIINAGMNPMPVSEDDLRFVDVKGKRIDVTLHIYRHTFATVLLEMGMASAAVAKAMDISIKVLHGTYGHPAPGGSEDMRAALARARLPGYRERL